MTYNHPPSILIVEDEPELCRIYKQYLKGSGFKVVSFTNPSLAFDYYTQNISKFAVVVTDVRMTGMSGIELACKIRKLNRGLKIFLITGYDIDDRVKNSKEYGDAHIDKVLEKPFKLKTLKEFIDDYKMLTH
ncbi:response regulator [Candidatus Nitrosocosmicus hydrocola]|uniref:response regulator n=1 Tax=Candidatus Nitrosocosmicus hydrocola TaxID=1826872 RepID=UPI0011E5EC8E|nr:response regulator [Candidatus Nitrosocosmicus hydrocola]